MIFLIYIVTILMISAKMATLSLLTVKVFWNKGHDLILFVHGVNKKLLSWYSDCIVVFVILPKSWFKFNNLRVALGIPLKLLGLTPTYVEVTGKKTGRGTFNPLSSWIGLKHYYSITKLIFLLSHTFWELF